MRALVVGAVVAGLVVLGAAGALADPPPAAPTLPALPALPAPLDADLSAGERSDLAQLTSGAGVGVDALVRTATGAQVVTLDAGTAEAAAQAAALLGAQPSVAGAGVTSPVHAAGVTASPLRSINSQDVDPWDLLRVHALGARSLVASALPSVTVAVIDSGGYLQGPVRVGRNFSASDAGNPTDTGDPYGHGSYVASLIHTEAGIYSLSGVVGGLFQGMAPDVRIMPVKVLDDRGQGDSAAVAQGITWAADHGADVENLSLSGPGDDPTVRAAVAYARSRGVVVVAAVGDEGDVGNPVEYPAADAGVIGVAATDRNDAATSFSERGPQVDIAAPGVDVDAMTPSTWATRGSGSSVAAPHVAAAAALVKAADRSATPDEVEQAIEGSAHDLGAPGRDDATGAGLVDLRAAVERTLARTGTPVPVDHPPVAAPDSFVVNAGSADAFTLDVTANDSDPDGDQVWVTAVGPAGEGTAATASGHGVAYTPAPGASGTDSFGYTLVDDRGQSATGTVTVTIAPATGVREVPWVNASVRGTDVLVTWSGAYGASRMRLYRNGTRVSDDSYYSWIDPSITNGRSYTYQVTSLDANGVEGAYSSPWTLVPMPAVTRPPDPPVNVYASPGTHRVDVQWSSTGDAAASLVYRNGTTVATVPAAGGDSFTDTGLPPGRYDYQVVLVGADGRSGFPSVTVFATVAATPIDSRYAQLGGVSGGLGAALGDEYAVAGGTARDFAGGRLLVAPGSSTAYLVAGGIGAAYAAAGGPGGPFGFPTTDTICGMAGGGCGQQFRAVAGYWSPGTGTHVVQGAVRDQWQRLGWEAGALGYPTTDLVCGLRGGGCGQQFQGGAVYWSPATGSHYSAGAIRGAWASGGFENGLGYPTTDTICGLRGGGCGQQFQAGAVYWSAGTGAHFSVGAVRDTWGRAGWETGRLGYPTTDTICGLGGGGCGQQFQGGAVYWSGATGSHAVVGAVRDQWGRLGWQTGRLGYPSSDEYAVRGGVAQHFQGGTLTWTQATGRVAVS